MSEEDKDSIVDPNDENKELGDDPENLGEEEEEEEEEDDGKPVTKKDLLDFRKGITSEINNRFAGKRHDQKSSKNYQSDSKKSDKDGEVPLNARLEKIEISNSKRDYGYEHHLSPKEVDIVFRFANNKPTAKTLEDPFVKGGIERLRTQASLRDNTPSGSGSSSFEVEGKKWEAMTLEEKQKNYPARQKAILAGKGK